MINNTLLNEQSISILNRLQSEFFQLFLIGECLCTYVVFFLRDSFLCLFKSRLEECYQDAVLINIPFQLVLHVFLFLYLFLYPSPHVFRYSFVVGGCFLFEQPVFVFKIISIVFVRRHPSFSFFFHLSEKPNCFRLWHVCLLSRVENRSLLSKLEDTALYLLRHNEKLH